MRHLNALFVCVILCCIWVIVLSLWYLLPHNGFSLGGIEHHLLISEVEHRTSVSEVDGEITKLQEQLTQLQQVRKELELDIEDVLEQDVKPISASLHDEYKVQLSDPDQPSLSPTEPPTRKQTFVQVERNTINERIFGVNATLVGGELLGGYFDGNKHRLLPSIRKCCWPRGGTINPLDIHASKHRAFPFPQFTHYYEQDFAKPLQNESIWKPIWNKGYITLHIHLLDNFGFNFTRNYADPAKIQLYLTRGPIPENFQENYQLINSISTANCLGGTKTQQLVCRQQYTKRSGCNFDDLLIQPPQFDMTDEADCKRFWDRAKKHPELAFLSKPTELYHGDGMQLYHGAQDAALQKDFGDCLNPKSFVMMDYVTNPVLMHGGFKFDLRSYVLVASMRPRVAFMYTEGLLRRSNRRFDMADSTPETHIMNSRNQSVHSKEHFFNFSTLRQVLAGPENNFTQAQIEHIFVKMQEVTKFYLYTEFDDFANRHRLFTKGKFQFFALDWVIDQKGVLWLLEGNKFPAMLPYPTYLNLSPWIWKDGMELVLRLHLLPESLKLRKFTVKQNYAFGRWKMLYNILEDTWDEEYRGVVYNPCHVFPMD